VRQLAVELSVNPNTIIKAYNELEIRGNLETQQGTTGSSWVRSSKR
jgi:GntR family transcriptional regulator